MSKCVPMVTSMNSATQLDMTEPRGGNDRTTAEPCLWDLAGVRKEAQTHAEAHARLAVSRSDPVTWN
jgi:hypothetical protein